MKHLKIYEQFNDDWDPFGEESDYDGIKVGDKVKVIKIGKTGKVVKITPIKDWSVYIVRFKDHTSAFYRKEIEKVEPLEELDIPFPDYEVPYPWTD